MLFALAPKPLLRTQVGQCTVELYQVRYLRQLRADALIVPSNRLLWMGDRVAKRVRDEAGDMIEDEARRRAPLAPGGVVVTGGGMLRVRHIVHVNILNEFQIATRELLESGLDSTLTKCEELGCRQVLIPDFTNQLVGWEAADCARLLLSVVQRNAQRVKRVLIACWDAQHAEAYRQVVAQHAP